jgi:GNAT superfamily N-acetyltransferase
LNEKRFVFEPLGGHRRAAFSCGEEQLDRYFRERASQDQRRSVASCFVLVDRVDQTVAGYYTLSAAAVTTRELPETFAHRLPRYPNLPAILIGRLAVDRRYQGSGLGRRLLVDALVRARDVTSQVGAVVIIVDALHEEAARFYEGFGFTRFEGTPLRLFLPVADLGSL